MNNTLLLKGEANGLVYAHMDPPDVDLMIELNRLPSRVHDPRAGRYVFSIWDVPGAKRIGQERGYEVMEDSHLEGMQRALTNHQMRLAYYKRNGGEMPLEVPGFIGELYKFQKAGVLFGANAQKYICCDDMGCGKTPQGIAVYLIHRAEAGGRLKALFICPTGLVDSAWRKKFRQFAGFEVAVSVGSPAAREKIYRQDNEVLVVSYANVIKDYKLISELHKADFLLMDEAHRIASAKAKATKAIFHIADTLKPRFIIPVTGSPVNNYAAEDIWPLLRLVNPVLAGSQKAYEAYYTKKKPVYRKDATGKPVPVVKKYGSGPRQKVFPVMKVAGYQNLDDLHRKLSHYMIRRMKSEVLKDLPPVTYKQFDVQMSGKERDVYDKLHAEYIALMNAPVVEGQDDPAPSILSWLIRAQQICCSLEIYNGDPTPSSKLEMVREYVREAAGSHKIVLFSRFQTMTEVLTREFADLNPVHYHGGLSQEEREPLRDAFQTDDKHRLFISTLKAGGEGLDLFSADIVAFYDQWWAPAAMDQARDRLHRIGQKNPVTVATFVVQDSIEQKVLEVLERKRALIAAVLRDEDLVKRLPTNVLKGLI